MIQSPRRSSSSRIEHIDRDATRNELERLLATAGTEEKKKKVKEALDHVEDGSSCRGIALANIVNDTLATASAGVIPLNKRRHSYHGREANIVSIGAGGDYGLQRRQNMFDNEIIGGEMPTGRNIGVEKDPFMAKERASFVDLRGRGTADMLNPDVEQHPGKMRRSTILGSIPENRIVGRRVVVKEISGENEKRGEGTGVKHGDELQNMIHGCGVVKRLHGTGREETKKESSLMEERGGVKMELASLSAWPSHGGKVVDVPQVLLGEVVSTGVDPSHPPSAAVDGALASFWLSTGLFPQTLTISLLRPVAVHEVMVGCSGVHAASVRLGRFNSTKAGNATKHSSSSGRSNSRSGLGGSRVGVGLDVGGEDWDERLSRGGRREECRVLELVREQRRPPEDSSGGGDSGGMTAGRDSSSKNSGESVAQSGSSPALARLVFRVPGGGGTAEIVDRLSLVVTSARAPFCLVTSVVIRGRCSLDVREDKEDYDASV